MRKSRRIAALEMARRLRVREGVEDDHRFDAACRQGMLAAAILHWIAAALMIWDEVRPSAWEYSAPARRYFASVLLELGSRVLTG